MKEKDARFEEGHRMVFYVEKEGGAIGPVETGSYMAQNYLDDFFAKRRGLAEETLRRLANGEISPVAYYMALIEIGEADLAARAGVSRRRLRRHLTPAGFAGLTLKEARRYAEIFGVPLADLFQVAAPGARAPRRERTASPFVVIARPAGEEE